MAIAFTEILAARKRIAGRVLRTPMRRSTGLERIAGVPVLLKCEHHQTTGSFKLRGATNAVLSLTEEEHSRGVVTFSTGNHGRALSHAAIAAGTRAVVCMSALVPSNKVEAIRALGADIRIVGKSQDEAERAASELEKTEGLRRVSPMDDAAVIAGQGTLGIEIAEDLPEIGTVVVPLSGGGLIAGIARAVKCMAPQARVIGVSMERGAAMIDSQRAGRPVKVQELPSMADSLGGGIGLDNRFTFPMVRDLVDDFVTVTEAEIARGIRHAYVEEREIIEGAAAVGIAALLAGKLRCQGPTVLLLSGRNIDMALHARVIAGEDVDLAHDTAGAR
jgi:threonine dehydratase